MILHDRHERGEVVRTAGCQEHRKKAALPSCGDHVDCSIIAHVLTPDLTTHINGCDVRFLLRRPARAAICHQAGPLIVGQISRPDFSFSQYLGVSALLSRQCRSGIQHSPCRRRGVAGRSLNRNPLAASRAGITQKKTKKISNNHHPQEHHSEPANRIHRQTTRTQTTPWWHSEFCTDQARAIFGRSQAA